MNHSNNQRAPSQEVIQNLDYQQLINNNAIDFYGIFAFANSSFGQIIKLHPQSYNQPKISYQQYSANVLSRYKEDTNIFTNKQYQVFQKNVLEFNEDMMYYKMQSFQYFLNENMKSQYFYLLTIRALLGQQSDIKQKFIYAFQYFSFQEQNILLDIANSIISIIKPTSKEDFRFDQLTRAIATSNYQIVIHIENKQFTCTLHFKAQQEFILMVFRTILLAKQNIEGDFEIVMDDAIIPPKSQFCRMAIYKGLLSYMDVGHQNIVIHKNGVVYELIPFKSMGTYIETSENYGLIINIMNKDYFIKFQNDQDKDDTVQYLSQVVNNNFRLLDIMLHFEGMDKKRLQKFKQINQLIIDKRLHGFESQSTLLKELKIQFIKGSNFRVANSNH